MERTIIFAKALRVLGILTFASLLDSCTDHSNVDDAQKPSAATNEPVNQALEPPGIDEPNVDTGKAADVTKVAVSGNPGVYTFAVTVESPDTGCEQYADWWEVLSENGELLYRRILAHSHTNEQPFTRSGNPVRITADAVVIVRAHMNRAGYGGIVREGTVEKGFAPIELSDDFAAGVDKQAPQPGGCAF